MPVCEVSAEELLGGGSVVSFAHPGLVENLRKLKVGTRILNHERDQAICRAYDRGFMQADIARAFDLSSQRVRQILDKHQVPRRSPCIPALLGFTKDDIS